LTVNMALTAPQSFKEASTAAHDMSLLPEGDGKAFIRSKCGLCHRNGFQEIILSRKDQDGWKQTLDKMRNHPYGYAGSLDITDQERDTLSEYLAANLGKNVPPLDTKANLPKSWVTGAAAKATVVEFDLPKGSYPHDVAVDSQGIVWVSERDLGYIGRLDPATFAYTRVRVPGEKVQLSDAIAIDNKDHSWVIDAHNSTAFEYNPETKSFAAYPYKPAGGPNRTISANTMRFLSDGSAWFTEVGASKVGKLDPATKQFTEYTPPTTAKTGAKTGPYGMAVDRAGVIWFPEELGDKVGKIDPKTGEITEYNPPTPASIPRRMGTDAEGNPWFSEYGAGNLVKIDYRTGKMTEYATPTKYAGPYGVEADMKHNILWVSECLADQMARFDPRTKSWVEYALPEHYLSVRKISVDPKRPTRVWFGEPFKDRVGYIEVAE
jgi:virginiamycin B lyase